MSEYYVGLDLGTSSVKAAAMDGSGSLLGWSTAAYPTQSVRPGWAEQRPEDWIDAARRALADLVTRLPRASRPQALAVTGQLPTLVLLGEDGAPLRPAIVWYDGRAEKQAATLLQAVSLGEWYRRTGVVLDAHYLAPMYAWVREQEPGLLHGRHTLCSAKDALVHALAGELATEPSTASGYGVYAPLAGDWDDGLCAAAGIGRQHLPPIRDSWSPAGRLGRAWAETGLPAGLPVIAGAGDALAGVLGCGAATPHTLAIINGTSSSLVVSADTPVLDAAHRFLLTPHAAPGLWGLEMDLMATGSALRWLSGLLGAGGGPDIFARSAGSPVGAHGLLALPYLAGGEQGALWDPRAPAAFIGLTLDHTADDLARALLEGIVFEMRRCLSVWEEAGVAVQDVVVSGGFDSRFFAPLAASALNRPVRVAPANSGSALGAAMLAAIGSGAWDMETTAAFWRQAAGEVSEPVAAEADTYDELFARYVRVSAAVREGAGPVL